MNSYIQFQKKFGLTAIRGANEFWSDSLVLIKANNHDDFQDLFEKELDIAKKDLEDGTIGGTFDEQYDLLYNGIISLIPKSRDAVYNDPELYAKAIKEAEKRKEKNIEILKEYKVI